LHGHHPRGSPIREVPVRKTWQEKFDSGKAPHVSVIDRAFAGVPAGGRLFIASPSLIDAAVRRVPRGHTRSVESIRTELAVAHAADATCPLTTGIFLRIVAERALAQLAHGSSATQVTPFWRVIDPDSALAGKLSCGPALIRRHRDAEHARFD
jgi:hypothetical protein